LKTRTVEGQGAQVGLNPDQFGCGVKGNEETGDYGAGRWDVFY